jgi:Ca2+-binding EF-hand superfamily protein
MQALILHHILFGGGYVAAFDLNNDEAVTFADVKQAYRSQAQELVPGEVTITNPFGEEVSSRSILHAALFGDGSDERYDLNNDGRVDLADVKKGFRKQDLRIGSTIEVTNPFGQEVSSRSILHAVVFAGEYNARYDLNQDDRLDLEDVKLALQGGPSPQGSSSGQPESGVSIEEVMHHALFESGYEERLDLNGDQRVDMKDVQALFLDVDRDGTVDSRDAAYILNHVLYNEEYTKDYDVNRDGQVNREDVKNVVQSIE